jgi:hypothetical protein
MMLLASVISIHEWVADLGIVDKLLSGDTTMCAIVGVLLGAAIGWKQLKQLQQID